MGKRSCKASRPVLEFSESVPIDFRREIVSCPDWAFHYVRCSNVFAWQLFCVLVEREEERRKQCFSATTFDLCRSWLVRELNSLCSYDEEL